LTSNGAAAVAVAAAAVPDNAMSLADYKEGQSYNKGDILSNEELLIRVKEYENSRAISNIVLATAATAATAGAAGAATDNTAASTQAPTSILPEIMEKVLTSINSSTNTFVNKKIGWDPVFSLKEGLIKTYNWIYEEIVSGRDIKKFSNK